MSNSVDDPDAQFAYPAQQVPRRLAVDDELLLELTIVAGCLLQHPFFESA
jgi:hypothetical protein